jgi:hypothetical protein
MAAAIVLFLAGIGATLVPSPMIWALFCMALGFLLNDYDFSFRRR